MKALKKLAGQTVVYGFSTILVRLLNYALAPFHTRVFENQADYGVIAEMYAWVAFLNVIFMYGMETAFFRFASRDEKGEKVFSTAFLSLLLSTAIFTGAIIMAAQRIANYLQYGEHPEYVICFALIIGFDTLVNIPFARLRLHSKALTYMLVKLMNVSINVALNFFFLLPFLLGKPAFFSFTGFIFREDLAVFYVFLANMIASLATLLVFIPSLFKLKWDFDKVVWKKMMHYALPLVIVGLAGMVNETMDRILLKNLLPYGLEENLQQVGIYSAVYKIAIFMTLVIQAFRMGAEPFFFKQSVGSDAKEVYASVMKYFVIVCCLIFLGVTLFIDVFKYIIGPRYHSGLGIVPILLMANLFLGIFYNLSVWYKLTDKTIYATWIALAGALITLIMNYFLIPVMGYYGSAWATLTCYVSITVISYFWGRKYYPIPYPVLKISGYILLSLFLFGVFKLLHLTFDIPSALNYLAASVFSMAFVAVVIWLERADLSLLFRPDQSHSSK